MIVPAGVACALLLVLITSGCTASESADVGSSASSQYSVIAIHEAVDVGIDASATADVETCTQCHSYDNLAEATGDFDQYYNPHDSHYGQLECYRCHSMAEAPEFWCTSCHGGLMIPAGWTAAPVGGGAGS